jgi:hypothetical protein
MEERVIGQETVLSYLTSIRPVTREEIEAVLPTIKRIVEGYDYVLEKKRTGKYAREFGDISILKKLGRNNPASGSRALVSWLHIDLSRIHREVAIGVAATDNGEADALCDLFLFLAAKIHCFFLIANNIHKDGLFWKESWQEWSQGSGKAWISAAERMNRSYGCDYRIGIRDHGTNFTFYLTEGGRNILWEEIYEEALNSSGEKPKPKIGPRRRVRPLCAAY